MPNPFSGPAPVTIIASGNPIPFITPYRFPTGKLLKPPTEHALRPMILVMCGSFSPMTMIHMSMFKQATEWVHQNTHYRICGKYVSPALDVSANREPIPTSQRLEICRMAADADQMLMVDDWETRQILPAKTALALHHFRSEIMTAYMNEPRLRKNTFNPLTMKIMLLAGPGLADSMLDPKVWSEIDVHYILTTHGMVSSCCP
ncbi:hypothetical protein BKA67DRAFT_521749 [Truncatella angustata]|uniref:Cytidyltransferase-like domain-containing protein n=1 Tax=Truncatella angustata TaxID=152316 RepID=A0A9P8UGX3_9PEZI|nr:uncharacterized protein BKA67DRAFT_521749 [Truncatella angustata]KAH6651889.1 hypothetical protein BKA67DRAFT_521749 [Truncatella angustata]